MSDIKQSDRQIRDSIASIKQSDIKQPIIPEEDLNHWERGFNSGYESGYKEGAKRANEVFKAASKLIETWEDD